ncbi:phosphoglucosamine mutase [Schleiferiaceae bacterium]|jgi:phosphomannomutase|nr:phosphoglucosamine mutase [Schleiferiaceae bacterium]HAR21879.1 phosphoglucosamine mutase [Cryomorphaceae bacterium]MDA9191759.1 phosphoglucosamine mutase [Schleiferiaceae bacterium]MDC0083511.1 phosphoglucosamine mutase [Schleiferiaceae bacterium]MDC0118328.1 phosphoglucosamine mutase [Schleiferiaceae bacterium]
MTLIKSISGIRGTIGGTAGTNLTPLDAVKFAAGYGAWLKEQHKHCKVVIGRDARPSGQMIENLVISTLQGLGIDVINAGLSTTPTVEMLVPRFNASGGIILTASHNPKEWNALKLLNEKGEFVSGEDGAAILRLAEDADLAFAEVDDLGQITPCDDGMEWHIEQVLSLPSIDARAVRSKGFHVAIDAVHSSGSVAIPLLLDAMGVTYENLYPEPTGQFPHNPEPLEKHLGAIIETVKSGSFTMGIVVDPDVDRLAFIDEKGAMFGEEYTLVLVADYLLSLQTGAVVSNMSSSKALRDLAEAKGGSYTASAVGEVNVVNEMKRTKAVLGGEGNGGIILPELHYGRDALVGIALALTHLAKSGKTMSELRAGYPEYYMAKQKIELVPGLDVDGILAEIAARYSNEEVSTIDGVKITWSDRWVHLRKSNTEPIVRIYTEAPSTTEATELGQNFMDLIASLA